MLVEFIKVALLIIFGGWLYATICKSSKNENRAIEAELALLHKKEQELQTQFSEAVNRQEFLERMALNLPGGYHRCTTDHQFVLTFISESFTQITGYTMEQIKEELDGSYMGIVLPEDREYFISLAPQLERDGYIHCSYRMRRRDGKVRWVQDHTQLMEHDGESYYQCALMDVTEQIEEINRARQEAELSSQAKSTFLFNISHDIRTPMNVIKGFATLIEENVEDVQLVKKTIRKIQQSSDTLMTLMNDVLDLSRIEKGKEELNLEPVVLQEFGNELFEMFVSDMKDAGLEFHLTMNIVHNNVLCDSLKMVRVGMNMLSNAKKFTPSGGTVEFGIDEIDSDDDTVTCRFYTRDTGVGMSKEFIKKAFEQFEREHTSTESKITGSGLGLAIIKNFVTLMGGTVEIQSELDKGTEISATITFIKVKDIQEEAQKQNIDFSHMKGKRVLLVEDNEFNREIARFLLEGMGLVVEEAENGIISIEMLMAAEPNYYDLIFMDIQMPVMDGYSATIEIRNLPDKEIANIPIIAMTANAFEEDKRKCMEIGMNGHIGKPIDVNDMKKVMMEVMKDEII